MILHKVPDNNSTMEEYTFWYTVPKLEQVRSLIVREGGSFTPVVHNRDFVALLGDGWWLVLRPDGTWEWADTTGG